MANKKKPRISATESRPARPIHESFHLKMQQLFGKNEALQNRLNEVMKVNEQAGATCVNMAPKSKAADLTAELEAVNHDILNAMQYKANLIRDLDTVKERLAANRLRHAELTSLLTVALSQPQAVA